MKINLKVTVNFRDDGDTPVFLIRMQNAKGAWWLVDARRWSDRHSDGIAFTDRNVAHEAVALLQQADTHHHRSFDRSYSVVQFKKGGI